MQTKTFSLDIGWQALLKDLGVRSGHVLRRAGLPDDLLSRGGNGFLSVAAKHAALLLAQGVGRLLRSTDDKGVVAILDSRLATARYGGYLRASLPPFWETADPKVVRQALARIAASRPSS